MPDTILTSILWFTVAAMSALTLWTVIEFIRERSPRAAAISGLFLGVITAALVAMILLLPAKHLIILIGFYGAAGIILLLLFLPLSRGAKPADPPTERVDERTIMFARARYKPGDDKYDRFYAEFPHLKDLDDIFRKLPGLSHPNSAMYDDLNAPLSQAIFQWIEKVRDTASGKPSGSPVSISPDDASFRLKGLSRYLGAADAGTTKVNPAHVYSRIGRGSGEWGGEIDADEFPWALVFTVEMDQQMMASTPMQPCLVDSSRQYWAAGTIALVIAEYLRTIGYEARAHIDGNYRMVMPPLAVDAGLGEIGRHSLLITPREGSRVRIGAVTTNLPLKQDEPIDIGVQDFCTVCLKCATNCPPKAITREDKIEMRGTRYWKMNQDSCFRFWNVSGTDCGICINVCPFSRPKGPLHSFVRLACRRSMISRRIFAGLDDLFYGKRPKSSRYPGWMKAGMKAEDLTRLKVR